MRCPACGSTNAPAQKFCGTCGAAQVSSDSETIASPVPARPPTDSGQYVPGQVLADRYRMVGLLGRGGMGEVYRADDLKLGQPVALKFLPRAVETDPDRLRRFLDEVRLSLKVTHPNVCRVFDIGEIDGRHFLSMEYVDGEDLASLLRRIGRLPEDKAVEIARQLCAGLAAAHDEGVLHRDLKPANVMIDGRGRAKITDFGLAGATAGIAGREAQAGTPQYMAPEQFDGRELSVQTDLYSLGLVLYELFTGKRAFDSRDLNELKAMHSSTPTSPSAHVAGLNPVVERAILRCVDPDPAHRPRSAQSLAAALPGGDPLAMAIAAGETPSPEMVARSGGGGELRPAVAVTCLLILLVGLGLIWTVVSRVALHNRIPYPKPPEELRAAARSVITAAGYPGLPSGSVSGFDRDTDYFNKISAAATSGDRWKDLPSVWPPPAWFWYREAARPMAPFNNFGSIAMQNPPMQVPGMRRVRLDPSGRLQEFMAVPADWSETPTGTTEPDWTPFFSAAGLTMSEWTATEPQWAGLQASDRLRAWTKGTVRIEAASMRGRPVWFRIIPDWRAKRDETSSASFGGQAISGLLLVIVNVALIAAAAFLARRNVRMGRGDKRGAIRLAVVYLCLGLGSAVFELGGDPQQWFQTLTRNFAVHCYFAGIVWTFYLAIEPYVRRLWPNTLVAWSRALEGRWRDPMVGRHILFGAIAGVVISFLFVWPELVAAPLGLPSRGPIEANLEAVDSLSLRIAQLCAVAQDTFFLPVGFLLTVLLFRVVFRRPWLAYTVLLAVVALVFGITPQPWTAKVTMILLAPLGVFLLTRFGLFAFVFAIMFSYWNSFALTLDPSSWIFPSSVVTMAVFAAIAGYGFWVSLGDQKLFKDAI